MNELDAIRGLVRQGRLPEAIARAAAVLATGPIPNRVGVWEQFFLASPCPVWTCARQACGRESSPVQAQACAAAVERLADPEVVAFVRSAAGRFAARLLLGMVRSIQAAANRRQGLPDAARYEEAAAGAYRRAFYRFRSRGLGRDVMRDVVERLTGAAPPERTSGPRVETFVLLAGEEENKAQAARLVGQRAPGPTGQLLPDPIALGLVNLSNDFLDALRGGGDVAGRFEPGPVDGQVCWWLEELGPVSRVSGRSGGAAAAAVVRAVRAGVRLDPCVAVSAEVAGDGGLGEVRGELAKWNAARVRCCDRVLFHPDTASSLRGSLPEAERDHVVPVKTFEQAWEHLTGRVPALEAYARAERHYFLDRLRFRPARLADPGCNGSAEPFNLLETLHVPMRVLTMVELPRDSDEAMRWEREEFRGNRRLGRDDLARVQRRGREDREERRYLAPCTEERLPQRLREQIRAFDEALAEWWGGQQPLVLLGDPGYGKSWLVALLTLRLLDRFLGRAPGHGTASSPVSSTSLPGQPPLPLRVTCRELGQALAEKRSLPEAIVEVVVSRLPTQPLQDTFRLMLQEHLGRERPDRVCLLVDGWDERDPAHEERLRVELGRWAGRPGRVIVTSRLVGHSANLLPDAARWQLMALEVPRGVRQLIERWFGAGGASGEQLWAALSRHPQLQQLVRVPLLGPLVCWMWQTDLMPPVPEQRTQLLKKALEVFLRKGREEIQGGSPVLADTLESVVDEVFHVLGRLAYETFTGQRWLVENVRLQEALCTLPPAVAELGSPRDLRKALTGRFGIFTQAPDQRLEVLHQSFAEMLCAWWVAEQFGKNTDSFRSWLRAHGGIRFLDPRWHEVWCHLAALVPDVTPLLDELLAMHHRARRWWPSWDQGPKDDMFATALSLAGICLASAAGSREVAIGQARQLWSLCRAARYRRSWVQGMKTLHLGPAAVPILIEALRFRDSHVQDEAAHALGEIGPAAAEAVPALIETLRAGDCDVQTAAAHALGRIGPAAAEAVPALIGALRTWDGSVKRKVLRDLAAEALGSIGPGAAAAIPLLIWLTLHDRDADVWSHAAKALSRIGPRVAVSALIEAFRSGNENVRWRVAHVLPEFGPAAAAAIPDLIEAIRSKGSEIRATAADALSQINPQASEAIPDMIEILCFGSGGARQTVAWALARMGPAAVPGLMDLLLSRDDDVRWYAAKVLSEIGPPADAIPALIEALRAGDGVERGGTVYALNRIGPAAVPDLLDVLLSLGDRVQSCAATDLSQLGPRTVPALTEALRFGDCRARAAAAYLLGMIRPAAGTAVPCLIEALRSGDRNVRKAAIVALGQFGPAAAAAVPDLIQALSSEGDDVKEAAVIALGSMGPVAAAAVPHLTKVLRSWRGSLLGSMRSRATWALGRIGAPAVDAVPNLVRAVHSHYRRGARAAVLQTVFPWGYLLFFLGLLCSMLIMLFVSGKASVLDKVVGLCCSFPTLVIIVGFFLAMKDTEFLDLGSGDEQSLLDIARSCGEVVNRRGELQAFDPDPLSRPLPASHGSRKRS